MRVPPVWCGVRAFGDISSHKTAVNGPLTTRENSNLTMFELRRFSPDSKFGKCFVVECKLVEKSLFYD